MPSEDVLRKLLEEFDEKEAQAREEIIVINVRIEELEKRIVASKEKLGRIDQDRTKIDEIVKRYVNGTFYNRSESFTKTDVGSGLASPIKSGSTAVADTGSPIIESKDSKPLSADKPSNADLKVSAVESSAPTDTKPPSSAPAPPAPVPSSAVPSSAVPSSAVPSSAAPSSAPALV